MKDRVYISVWRATELRGRRSDPESHWCGSATSCFYEVFKGYFKVPVNVKCDRSFIERPGDAVHIERMWLYLFNRWEDLPPICTDARLYEVVVTADKAKIQQHQLMWAILIMRNKIVTFEDLFVARRSMTDIS